MNRFHPQRFNALCIRPCAMAGAAVGTVLLGPVLGTSIGIKAGEFTQNLFGKKEEKQEKQEKQDK